MENYTVKLSCGHKMQIKKPVHSWQKKIITMLKKTKCFTCWDKAQALQGKNKRRIF